MLADAVKSLDAGSVLEIGVGSAIVMMEFAEAGRLTVGTDISLEAVKYAQRMLRERDILEHAHLVCCDGAQPFRKNLFDIVVTNPPYLPSDDLLDKAIDGGTGGISVARRLLKSALPILRRSGRCLLITSSLSEFEILLEELTIEGYHCVIKKKSHLFFEDLMLIEISSSH